MAAAHGLTTDRLRTILTTDPAAHISTTGRMYYVDAGIVDPPMETSTMEAPPVRAAAPYPYSDTFLLHSKSGSSKVIYLDFDGHTLPASTGWAPTSPTFPAWDSDGVPASFSDGEKDAIQGIWQRVAEDFAALDVDVTTEEPAPTAIDRVDAADTNYGTRAVITEGSNGLCSCGGLAYVGVFNTAGARHDYYQPALVFGNSLGPDNEKYIADATSHEVGHNLGLSHDGRTSPVEGYYAGANEWGPIMGAPYRVPVTQFSKGEYPAANNTQDDLAVIQAHGLPYRADEAGSTYATAVALSAGGTINQKGVITQAADVDAFSFSTPGGVVGLTADPAPNSPNLDIQLSLLSSTGTEYGTANPAVTVTNYTVAAGMGATLSTTVPAGEYVVLIEGSGAGLPTNSSSDYGSIGEYTLTGSYDPPVVDVTPPSVTIDQASGQAGQADPTSVSPVHFTVAFSEPVSGFATGDVSLSGTANASTATVTETAPTNGTTFDVAVSGMTGAGTVVATIAANAAVDAASNGNTASTSTDNAVTFTVVEVTYPDLTIAKSHVGSFSQGQLGATYSIVVGNSGTAATSGTVTVVDTLPADLTATGISGAGWNCVVATLTCARSTALASDGVYPSITVTVDVAANAAASVTNSATVGGGGEVNLANDRADDVTSVSVNPGSPSIELVPDPYTPGKLALLIVGTDRSEVIALKDSNAGKVKVLIDGVVSGTFTPTGMIIVIGRGGADRITAGATIAQGQMLFGGDGNDTIVSGNRPSIVIGGTGDDDLKTGSGRDILIGGVGLDKLRGNAGDDILVTGSTSYDDPIVANETALGALLAEWMRTDVAYAGRIAHVNGTIAGGLNGVNVLRPATTVFDDTSKDASTGATGTDWFLLNRVAPGAQLETSDRTGSEVATDI